MTRAPNFEIEHLSQVDLVENVSLSRSVGWHDVESEWQVLYAAAEVQGARSEGRLVAQGALASYGNSASLAKMVVTRELQGRGLGARLLDTFLTKADALGLPVGLCATDQGRPLYASRGFVESGELMILFGAPELGALAPGAVATLDDVERAVEQDLQLSGCDRSSMLRARFADSYAKVTLEGERRGFGLATLQGEHAVLGPILAENAQDAQALCGALLARVARPARIDVPLQQLSLRRWLVQLGLREMSTRVEMARGAPRLPWQVDQRFALAGQAWG